MFEMLLLKKLRVFDNFGISSILLKLKSKESKDKSSSGTFFMPLCPILSSVRVVSKCFGTT